MQFHQPNTDFYVPDGSTPEAALARTTHLSVTAHQDDIELMAYHGIVECFGLKDKWFTGVVVTNGAGSPRAGIYADYTDEDMQVIRREEQRKAAHIGSYGAMIQLNYTSGQVKDSKSGDVTGDLFQIFSAAKPEVVYLHNLADKHDTHLGTALRSIAALRQMAPADRPKKVYGCEVWRALDWLNDEEKQCLPVSKAPGIANALIGVFDSQVSGGKRYDLATAGRRLANATYFASHATDTETALTFAMDLTPLINDPALAIVPYVTGYIDRFKADVENKLTKLG